MPEVDHFLGTDEVVPIADAIAGRTDRVQVLETPRYLTTIARRGRRPWRATRRT